MSYNSYAGIGSRETPSHICDLMFKIGRKLGKHGWLLRSGHAKGSDRAFEDGCDASHWGKKEIYTAKSQIPPQAFVIARAHHPAWDNCDEYAQRLHARNSLIILGATLDDPVDIVLCYAPGGNKWGGTSQGIRVAQTWGIPILNMHNEGIYQNLKDVYDRD